MQGSTPGFNSRTPGGVRRVRNVPVLGTPPRFNSRTPGGVRRDDIHSLNLVSHVSIHAPREGCDLTALIIVRPRFSFNSRTPGGVRLLRLTLLGFFRTFQFTHPGRGATYRRFGDSTFPVCFNSRTPGGVRLLLLLVLPLLLSFNSRTPGGVRLKRRRTIINAVNVSIHAPREGCDCQGGASLLV